MVGSSFPQARRFARTPVLFASIRIGNEAQGLILNGSEGGICVQITNGSVGPGLVDLQFQSAAGHAAAWVGCRGRVIWKSEDRTVVGIEFVDTTPLTNREIKNWLSFGQSLRELREEWPAGKALPAHWTNHITPEETPAIAFPDEPPPSQKAPSIENAVPESEPEQPRSQSTTFGQDYEDATPRFRILRIVALVIIVLIGAVAVVRMYESGWNFRNIVSRTAGSNQSPAAGNGAEPPATNAAVPNPQPTGPHQANSPVASSIPGPAPAPHGGTSPIASTSRNSGLVLQAGAMTDEQNAKEMAQSLQQKHFPAFVYKKDGDRFFRVYIGPYASDESLRDAQTKLRSLNVPTIKKKSAP